MHNRSDVESFELQVVLSRFRKATNRLSDLIDRPDAANRTARLKAVDGMDDLVDTIHGKLPWEGHETDKGPFEFKNVAKEITFQERWHGDQSILIEKEALQETLAFKMMLQEEDIGFSLDEFTTELDRLAPSEYEKMLTQLHCREAVNAFQEYKKLVLQYYFNNDPYDHGDELGHAVGSLCSSLNVDVIKQDIFEETLLKLAGVTTQPDGCGFDHLDPYTLLVSVKGINESDAETFVAYLREVTNDPAASYEYVASTDIKGKLFPNEIVRHALVDAYQFSVDIKKANENLVPLFVAEVERMTNDNPSELERYRDTTENYQDPLIAAASAVGGYVASVARSAYTLFAGPSSPPVEALNQDAMNERLQQNLELTKIAPTI